MGEETLAFIGGMAVVAVIGEVSVWFYATRRK